MPGTADSVTTDFAAPSLGMVDPPPTTTLRQPFHSSFHHHHFQARCAEVAIPFIPFHCNNIHLSIHGLFELSDRSLDQRSFYNQTDHNKSTRQQSLSSAESQSISHLLNACCYISKGIDTMKLNNVTVSTLLFAAAVAHPQHQHQHQKLHEHRDVKVFEEVVEIVWEVVTETAYFTTTLWVSDGQHAVATTIIPPSGSPGEFYQPAPSFSTILLTSSVNNPPSSAAQPSPLISSSSPSSVDVPPTQPASTSAPVPSTSAPPIANTPSSTAPAPPTIPAAAAVVVTSAAVSTSGYSGTCSSSSPCTGDITYYQAGLGACGLTTDGDTDMVIALPHELMGTQSNGNPYCGKTVTISANGHKITAIVVDKCMGCVGYSIDLSNAAFLGLGYDLNVGRTTASWYFN